MCCADEEQYTYKIYIFLDHLQQTKRVVGEECINRKMSMPEKLRLAEP
jgi:hypothetical protein